MASADLELQAVMVRRLKTYGPLSELVNDRVFDRVPTDARLPYVTLGESSVFRRDATCVRGQTIMLTLHVWSDDPRGHPEAKMIADAIAEALHDAPITLPTHKLVSLEHRKTRVFTDADGVTTHAVIEIMAYVHKP